MRTFLLSLLCVLSSVVADAKIKLPALISDNMVLQQKSDVIIWGWATPHHKVSIRSSWNGATFVGNVDNNGKWFVAVTTPEASFDPQSLIVYEMDGKKEIDSRTISNVLVGEVWLASGQSNMEMPLGGMYACVTENGTSDAMHAMQQSPYVRMFKVPVRIDYRQQDDCAGTWDLPTFQNALKYSATAYYFASALSSALQVPVGIVNCSYGGTRIECWLNKETVEKYPDVPTDRDAIEQMVRSYRPYLTYNGMFCPVKNYTYKGIIWYQGCSNVGKADVYAQRMSDMVSLWRSELDLGQIPFYFVEITPRNYGSGEAGRNGVQAAYLREAQYKAQKLIPYSGMVSTNDLVREDEQYNWHPSQKRQIGERLSLLALNRTYGMESLVCVGPSYKSYRVEDNAIVVSFKDVPMGFMRDMNIQGFEIANENHVFYPATAQLLPGTTDIKVSSPNVSAPLAVRYCFRDFQVGNVYGANELPLYPFRTDNW